MVKEISFTTINDAFDSQIERMQANSDFGLWIYTHKDSTKQMFIKQLVNLVQVIHDFRFKIPYFSLDNKEILSQKMKDVSLAILDSIKPFVIETDQQIIDLKVKGESFSDQRDIKTIVDLIAKKDET